MGIKTFAFAMEMVIPLVAVIKFSLAGQSTTEAAAEEGTFEG